MRALSTRNDDPKTASRPWDAGRDGFVVGEGAGVLVLEEYEHAVKRGATILSELVGYAANSDAYHTNAPPEDGRGVRRVMQLALADAGIAASDVKYLNAHATSTPLGDRAEARAICDDVWRCGKEFARQFDQVHDRASARRRREPGGWHHGAVAARPGGSADD